MEEFTQIAQSLSPYIVISVVGDSVKTNYIKTWGESSSMPRVWLRRFQTPEGHTIIVNIWGEERGSIVPPDHTLIVHDCCKDLTKLETCIKEFAKDPLNTTVLLHNYNEKSASMVRQYNLNFVLPEASADFIKETCMHIHGNRVVAIDRQINMLVKHKMLTLHNV
jgi:hypothetical protein